MHSSHQDHSAQNARAHAVHEESPLDIIKRRYASGEITREEFEQLKRDLAADGSSDGTTGHQHVHQG